MLFTVHYLMLRGYYALELTRTVFFIQCAVAAVNITAALLLVTGVSPRGTSPALVVAYGASYAAGAAISYVSLSRRLARDTDGDVLQGRRTLRFLVRLVVRRRPRARSPCRGGPRASGPSTAPSPPGGRRRTRRRWCAGFHLVAFVLLARVFRITEVTSVISQVSSRLSSEKRPTA